jgi:L-alanine-DL-glutamate epimerase-like enolase superfamily enzyme
VDIALWDIKGKHLGQPVWKLLGGYSATVPAYITFGLLEYTREQLVEAAKQFTAQGHDKLKMVVAINGAQDPAEDAARVRAVREAIGDQVELMVDANYLFSFPVALDLAKRIEPYGIKWFEEPVYGNDARLLANLRRQTKIPISAGQNEGHKWRHRELLVHEAVDILQPNVVYVGGYTEGVKVAAMAQAYNIPIANGGGWPHHNMHLIAGVANGWRVEFHVPMWVTGEMIFKDPPKPSRGTVTLTDQPGLGLTPNEEALKETREP